LSEQPPVRIQVLDGFRAVAILLVIGFHWFVRWAPPWSNTGTQPWGDVLADVWLLKFGRTHACFFFILSGFVILLTLERCKSFPDFFRKRVARLWPTLVVCALLTTAILYGVGKSEWTRGPASIFLSTLMIDPAVFRPLFPNADLGWVDGAYWTLAVEARFYILVGLIYLVGRRLFLPLWLALQAVSFALGSPWLASIGALEPLRLVLMPIWLPYLTLGVCLFEIYRSGRWPLLPTLGAVAAAAMILVNAYAWSRFAFEDPLGRTVINAGWIALSVLFVIKSPLVKPFGWKPLVWLGGVSYPLFLLHEAGGMGLMQPLRAIGLHPLAIFVIVAVAMIGLSFLIFRFVEEPAKNRILGATKSSVARLSQRAPWLDYRPPADAPAAVSHGRASSAP
jgi:peptidoglycan/LPS O-acetylase OafA/YrhL